MRNKLLSEVWQEYSSKIPELKWNTLRSYGTAVGNLIKAIGDKPIDKIDQNDIEDFKVWLFKDARTPASIESSMKNARPLFTWAMKRKKYIDSDPFSEVKKPKVPKKEIRIYDEAELSAMLCCAPNLMWQTIIVAAASAGLRKGEILNLRFDDVNFDDGYIIVQAHERTKDCWPWEPKSWECRQVPLSDQLKDLFLKRRSELPPEQPYIHLEQDRYSDLQRRRQPEDGKTRELPPRIRYTPNENWKPFRNIIRKAEIDDGRTFHCLRSTAITNWLYAGLLPHEVQILAGHEHIETTMKHYVFVKNDVVQRARIEIGVTGFAPVASGSPNQRSTKLSYTPNN